MPLLRGVGLSEVGGRSCVPDEAMTVLLGGGGGRGGQAGLAWSPMPVAYPEEGQRGRRWRRHPRPLPIACISEGGMNRILFGDPQWSGKDGGGSAERPKPPEVGPEAVPVWELMYEEGGGREAGAGIAGVPGTGRRRRSRRQLAWHGTYLRPLSAAGEDAPGEDPGAQHLEDNDLEFDAFNALVMGLMRLPPVRWARKVAAVAEDVLMPDDVEESYWEFTRWKLMQRGLSSAAGVLATQSMLHAVGVGRRAALPSAAAANWVIKDGMGKLGKLVASAGYGSEFDADLKRHRFASSALYQVCIGLELCTAFFPAAFLPMASLANVGKSIGITTAVSVAPSIARTFLKPGHENLAELTAKTNAQIVIADNVGLGLAVAASWAAGRRLAAAGLSVSPLRWGLPLALFPALAVGDLFCISRELRAVCFRTLNVERAGLMAGAYLRGHQGALGVRAGEKARTSGTSKPDNLTPRPDEVAPHEACAELPLSLRHGEGAWWGPFQADSRPRALVFPSSAALNEAAPVRLAEISLDPSGGRPARVAEARRAGAQLPLSAVSVGDLVRSPEDLSCLLASTRSPVLSRPRRYMLCARKFGKEGGGSVRWDLALVVHEDASAEDLLAAGLHAHAASVRLKKLLVAASSAGPRQKAALATVLRDLDAGRPLRCKPARSAGAVPSPQSKSDGTPPAVPAEVLIDRALGEALSVGAQYADEHSGKLAEGARAQGWDLNYVQLGGFHRRCSWE